LVDEGYEVVGVTLHLWDQPEDGGHGRCCAPEDVRDARHVADQLGFRHYALDRRDLFRRSIVEPFVDEYLAGRTPSPCATCNQQIKIPELLRVARMLGAPKVATGHYARIIHVPSGHVRVARGLDRHKDQSYFLYALAPDVLARVCLPLGETHKRLVRAEALQRGLVGAGKGESQDLCFIAGGDYIEFVEQRAGSRTRPGRILDEQGQQLGWHRGVHRFTLGQRKGLGMAAGQPVFVTRIDPASGDIVVGAASSLLAAELWIGRPSWADGAEGQTRASVQVRYRHEGALATLHPEGCDLRVVFDEPIRAPSPGQVAVAYDGDVVVAGGVIDKVLPASIAYPRRPLAT
jgi:tRNA-specific 2-thiouridylase